MTEISKELENLGRIGKLTPEPGTRDEIAGLLTSGAERLADARNEGLALSSRFDLAYNAGARLFAGGAAVARLSLGQPLSGVSGTPAYPPAACDDVAGTRQGARAAQRRGVAHIG